MSKTRQKKPFVLECKFIKHTGWPWGNDWGIWDRYQTQKQRDQALECLKKKNNNNSHGPYMEFRPVDEV